MINRAINTLRRLLGPLPVESGLLIVPGLAAGAFWAFIELADDMLEGDTRQVDEAVLLALRHGDPSNPWGPRWFEEMMRDFTALGSAGVLVFLTAAAIGYLLLDRKVRAALFVLVAVAGGLLLSTLMKLGFDRPRPELMPPDIYVYSASFPSGHSMMAAVTYLTLGALLVSVERPMRHRIYVLLLALVLTMTVGVSRVYLGVHWPSDVGAGWAIGAGWALLCWSVMRWLQQRGQVEAQDAGEASQVRRRR
jgi:undecaprenyl-diphosphatase